ncbi:facilitated trehalose transporter Tret1-like [Diabrotica undecimpunctata]|uniref:facilitated trehalose transporter Tret1-like n=1 Tax=Diabrotica undecimpunctata TaxID=50387 RepID=UPI003B634C03
MDISASCFSLNIQENRKAIKEEQKQDAKFQEIIVSCKSLSRYDGKTLKTLLPQVLAAILAASLHMAVGLSLSFSGILVPALDKQLQNGTDDDGQLYASKDESAWIASVVVIIVPVGSITAGLAMDAWGRLWAVRLAIIPTVIGWCLIASASSISMIIAGRLLTGFATAWASIPATVYITEIARADMRGSLVVTAPSFASLGMLICFLKGWFLHWRTVAWLCNIYAIIPILFLFLIPESPAWLVSKGKIEEAARSLNWLNKYQPQPENRHESLAELQLHALQKEHQAKLEEQARIGDSGAMSKVKEFFKPTGYKPLLILTGLFFFQQFAGIYITLFYSVNFFNEVGSTINPYLASVMLCLIRMVMALSNSYFLKTFNRRSLLITSGFGMAFCTGLSGLFTYLIKEGSLHATWLPIASLLLFVVASMIGFLPIPWTMMAELFPLEIRGVANSIAYSIGNLLMFAAIQSFWGLVDVFHGFAGVQWFFAVVALFASVYTYIFVPETHRKKLSEITSYFQTSTGIYILSQKKSPRKSATPSNGSRVAKKDIVLSANGQNEKLIQNV